MPDPTVWENGPNSRTIFQYRTPKQTEKKSFLLSREKAADRRTMPEESAPMNIVCTAREQNKIRLKRKSDLPWSRRDVKFFNFIFGSEAYIGFSMKIVSGRFSAML